MLRPVVTPVDVEVELVLVPDEFVLAVVDPVELVPVELVPVEFVPVELVPVDPVVPVVVAVVPVVELLL